MGVHSSYGGGFRIEVQLGCSKKDALRVRLESPAGHVLLEHTQVIDGGPARPIYEALLTAMAEALRRDCRQLTVDFAPASLLSLLRPETEANQTSLERSIRRWAIFQLHFFDHVSLHGTPIKQAQARLELAFPRTRIGRA